MATYTYYGPSVRNDYRLVIETGRPLPDGIDPGKWKICEVRPYEAVHKEVMRDIETQGFGGYRQFIRPNEMSTSVTRNEG